MKYSDTFFASTKQHVDKQLSNGSRRSAVDLGISVDAATRLMAECYALSGHSQPTKELAIAELKRKAKDWLKAEANRKYKNVVVRATYGSIWIMIAMTVFAEIIKLIIAQWWDS